MQSAAVWNTAFTQTNYAGVRDLILIFFTDARCGTEDSVIVSRGGHALALLHCRVTSNAPAADMYGHMLWDYINVPRVGSQTVWTPEGVPLTPSPSILADVWLQIRCQDYLGYIAHAQHEQDVNGFINGVHPGDSIGRRLLFCPSYESGEFA